MLGQLKYFRSVVRKNSFSASSGGKLYFAIGYFTADTGA